MKKPVKTIAVALATVSALSASVALTYISAFVNTYAQILCENSHIFAF